MEDKSHRKLLGNRRQTFKQHVQQVSLNYDGPVYGFLTL
jgi:hypothetical protein